MNPHRLIGSPGCGSAIVEAAFAVAGVPLECEEVGRGARRSCAGPSCWWPPSIPRSPTAASRRSGSGTTRRASACARAPTATARPCGSEFEAAAGAPWFLGDARSAIDFCLAVMTRWRPGPKCFAANAPKLAAIAQKASATPGVADVIARNF